MWMAAITFWACRRPTTSDAGAGIRALIGPRFCHIPAIRICEFLRMVYARHSVEPAVNRHLGRARRARRWAWLTGAALATCVMAAIWQEPALAPKVHDGMQQLASKAQTVIDGNEKISAFLTRWEGGLNGANKSRHDPVTELLLRAQN